MIQNMILKKNRGILLALLLVGEGSALFALPGRADTILILAAEDTAPYSFLPNLARHNNAALYAFQSQSEEGTNHDFETYLWFDVSADDLPPGHVLDEAFLAMTYAFDFDGFGDTSNEPGVLDCHEVLQPWEHTTLTWSNRPAIDPVYDTITGIESFGSLVFDVSGIVQQWIGEVKPNEGFALTSPTARVLGMHSLEADVSDALKPTLVLITALPEPGVGVALAGGVLGILLLKQREIRGTRPTGA